MQKSFTVLPEVVVTTFLILMTHLVFGQQFQYDQIKCSNEGWDTIVEMFNNAYKQNLSTVKKLENDSLVSLITTAKHILPEDNLDEAIKAFSYFPELFDDKIIFKYRRIDGTMNARPDFLNLFRPHDARRYIVLINNNKGKNKGLDRSKLSFNSLVGWYGHEFGHIFHYHEMTNLQSFIFTIKYLISIKYVKKTERYIDALSINRGLAFEIFEGEKMIQLDNSISDRYKKRSMYNGLTDDEFICLWYIFSSTRK